MLLLAHKGKHFPYFLSFITLLYDKFNYRSAKDGESAFDNRDPANCPSNGGVPVSHMCCGGHDRPWYWIGMNKNQCCATDDGNSGIVTKSSETCENGNFIAP